MEVEEQDIDADGNILSTSNKHQTNVLQNDNKDLPMIRDSSRNRLQRLGALYSDTENLSSPIHRNEARFDDNLQQTTLANSQSQSVRPIKRIGKLAALADSINNWEDDLSHSDTASASNRIYKHVDERNSPTKYAANQPKIVATSLRKQSTGNKVDDTQVKSILSTAKSPQSSSQRKVASNLNANKSPSKQLKWDQHVMDALEQQGFQRRESTNSKLIYDFKGNRELSRNETVTSPKKTQTASPKVDVSKGLVSGRTALFENAQKSSNSPQKSHKDPAELPIKERLALFEKNKGNALIPKAALGMAPSVKQIMADRKEEKISSSSITSSAEKPKINSFNKAGNKIITECDINIISNLCLNL